MYGTTMIAKVKPGLHDRALDVTRRWLGERGPQVDGFLGEQVMLADDGTTVVAAIRFASREAYRALGDDPAQDEFYRTHMVPLLDGQVRWIDGTWHEF